MKKGFGHSGVRGLVWGVGVVLCLGYYAVKNTHPGRSNPVGRETALFPRWGLDLQLRESPASRRWILTDPDTGGAAGIPDPPGWPPSSLAPRRVTFWSAAGTWEPQGRALRRVWRFQAEQWLDEQHLMSIPRPLGEDSTRLHLDLRSGRTAVRPWSWEDVLADYEGELYAEEPDLLSVLNSPLEPAAENVRFRKQRRFAVGDRQVYLLWAPWTKGERHPIYAASDDAAPRLLKVVDDGVPLELARDGRTLFFSRGNVLWRLDLRRPLPELLDAVPLPTLPEPPLE